MMLPTHVVLVLHAFSSVTWDDQTYVGCEHDALTLSWNGHHNVIELQNYDDCASNITGQLVPYHDAGYVEPIPPSMLASPGATRYYKCGLHCDAGAKFAITCPADACPHLSTDACRAWRQFVDTFLIRENLDGNAYLDPCNSVHITCRNGVVTELHSTASPLPASHEPVFTFEQRDWVQDYFPNASYMEIVFMVLSSSQPTVWYPTPLANVTDLRINCPVGAMPSSYTTLTRLTVYGNCVYDHDARGALASNLSQLEYLSTYRFTAYPKSYKLNGTLPSDAPRLQHLSVPYNDLTGTIPANMAQLTYLDVRGNKLTGTVNVPSTVHTCNLTDPYTFKDLWIRYFYNNPTYTLQNHNTFTCPLPAHCTGVCFGTPNTSCGGLSANATKDQCDAMITLLLKYASRESFENLTIYNATTQTYDFCGRTERHCTQAGRGDLGFFDAGSLKLQCRHAEHNCTFTDELVNALSNIYIHSAIIIDGYTGALPQQLPLLNSAQQFRITNSTFRCPYPEWVKLDPTFASAPCVPALADTAPAPAPVIVNGIFPTKCKDITDLYGVQGTDLKLTSGAFPPQYLGFACSDTPLDCASETNVASGSLLMFSVSNCAKNCDCRTLQWQPAQSGHTCDAIKQHFKATRVGNITHWCDETPSINFMSDKEKINIFDSSLLTPNVICGCTKNCDRPTSLSVAVQSETDDNSAAIVSDNTMCGIAPLEPFYCNAMQQYYDVDEHDITSKVDGTRSCSKSCFFKKRNSEVVSIENCKTNCDCKTQFFIIDHDFLIKENKTCAQVQAFFNVSAANVSNFTHTCETAPDMIFKTGIFQEAQPFEQYPVICGCQSNCDVAYPWCPTYNNVFVAAAPVTSTAAPTPAPTPPLPRARAPHEKASLWYLLLLLAPALAIAYR